MVSTKPHDYLEFQAMRGRMVGKEYIMLSFFAKNIDPIKNSSPEFTMKRSQLQPLYHLHEKDVTYKENQSLM